MEKSRLRAAVRAARDGVADIQAASAAVSRRLEVLPELAVVRTVVGYAATAREVSIDAALRSLLARGVTVCLPWVQGPSLGIGRIEDLEADLTAGWRGLREPVPGRRLPLRPSAVDAVLVPGLAFDRAGNRLGHGGGHFDRLLGQVGRSAVLIGIAHDVQVVDAVPVEAHDRPVDVVVTPSRTLRTRARL